MAVYKDIRGTHITTVANDPPAPVNGQMWYNSTSQTMKGFTSNPAGSWATGGDLNTGRAYLGSAGTSQTASLAFGGYNTPPATRHALNESYNGTSWTELADLNTARNDLASGGTSTSALGFGGYQSTTLDITESWNGSSWTEVADLNTGRTQWAGCGADNEACLGFGGYPNYAITETWNGTSWTEVGDLNQARSSLTGAGTNTAALAISGENSSPVAVDYANVELWNGSAWTEIADVNDARDGMAASKYGTSTSAIAFGGPASSPITGKTEGEAHVWSAGTSVSLLLPQG